MSAINVAVEGALNALDISDQYILEKKERDQQTVQLKRADSSLSFSNET